MPRHEATKDVASAQPLVTHVLTHCGKLMIIVSQARKSEGEGENFLCNSYGTERLLICAYLPRISSFNEWDRPSVYIKRLVQQHD